MAGTRTGSKRLLRDLNQNIVFNLIAEHGTISRTELAKQSRLPAATITRIVGDFIAAGLVSEGASEESSGGRRPVLLSINPSAGHVVGVKLREDSMTVTICDLSCTPLYTCEQQIPGGATPQRVVEVIAEAVKRCCSEAGVSIRGVLGVGVGLSGLIDSSRGICRYSAILGWRDVELGPALEFKLHLPVRVDNDVNTLAVAERYFGAGRDAANFLLVTVGRGVGLGIVVRGEIYRGSHGGAGEFGHMTVDTTVDAPMCNCGKQGCLEAVASDYGILRAATGTDPGHHVEDTIGTLIDRAQSGDKAVQAIFTRAGVALGIAIANLINIFDPARVLIGGEGLRAGDLILNPMRTTIPQHTFGPSSGNIDLIVDSKDETNWARGAASLILREMFQSPIYENEEALVIDDLLSQVSTQRRRKE
jgi:predicted NBD/HSP70 family sugar kinase